MRQVWASIAFIGFFLSFMIHVATYGGFNAGEVFPLIWILHIVALMLWFVMVLKLRGQRNWNKVLEPLPIWCRKLLGICFIYTAINFAVIFIGEVGKGVPQRMNGQYVIYRIDDGRRVFVNPDEMPNTELELVELKMIPVLRETEGTISVFSELTEAEYYQRTLPVVRGFSGHWMLFFLVPALYFWYKEP
jgi:hypothetical protein